VIKGPGENAGVIDIGDGLAAIFKMESHNHPSFIEPYQGAATGVGGILRDVFTMGARPHRQPQRAALRRAPTIPRRGTWYPASWRASAATAIAIGVPTVGGETNFHPAYNGNILVNAMTVGIAPGRPHFLSRRPPASATRVVYVGVQDRARRHPRRHHGLGRIHRGQPKASARPCRSATPSPRSCCWKPASN
jgi:phosphoribosylformylglycinamidine (FGAM) synthase-like enzyme